MALLCCTDLDAEGGLAWLAAATGASVSFNMRSLHYFGLSTGETSGWQWQWAVHPADLPALRRALDAAWRTGDACRGRFRLRRSDGVYCWHVGCMTPVDDESGRQAGWLATCADLLEAQFADAPARIRRAGSPGPVIAISGG